MGRKVKLDAKSASIVNSEADFFNESVKKDIELKTQLVGFTPQMCRINDGLEQADLQLLPLGTKSCSRARINALCDRKTTRVKGARPRGLRGVNLTPLWILVRRVATFLLLFQRRGGSFKRTQKQTASPLKHSWCAFVTRLQENFKNAKRKKLLVTPPKPFSLKILSLLITLLLFMLNSSIVTCVSALPSAPYNLTVTRVFGNGATVAWDWPIQDMDTAESDIVEKFEMNLRPLTGEGDQESPYQKRTVSDVRGAERHFMFEGLTPDSQYEFYVVAKTYGGMWSNASEMITFRTLTATAEAEIAWGYIQPGEITIVALIILAWFAAIGMFLHKWGKIRILQPSEPRYKHNPKNLDTIKVVKHHSESVIHRAIPKNFIGRAREKRRIARMNTMPNIKVEIPPGAAGPPGAVPKKPKKVLHLPIPIIELQDFSKICEEDETAVSTS